MTVFSIISENDPLFQKIRHLEESLWITKKRFNDQQMKETFAPDFFEFGRSGKRYSYEEMFIGSDDEDLQQEIKATIPLLQLEMRKISNDTVLVTYISEVVYDGVTEHGNRSSLWSLLDDKWRLRFHQGTPTTFP